MAFGSVALLVDPVIAPKDLIFLNQGGHFEDACRSFLLLLLLRFEKGHE